MKPLPFSETLAHPPHDLLSEHLLRVAKQAADSIPNNIKTAKEIAFIAGLFHDMGKASHYFQVDRLKNNKKTNLTKHSEMGAILSWWYTAQLRWELWQRLAVFNAIHRHHSPLDSEQWQDFFVKTRQGEIKKEGSDLHKQLISLDLLGIQQWLESLATIFDFLPEKLTVLTKEAVINELKSPKGSEIKQAFQTLEHAVLALAGFGGLLANDKLDTATSGKSFERQTLPVNAVETYKKRKFFTDHGLQPPVVTSALELLNQQRTVIAEEVLQTWQQHLTHHLLTLTAPTGAGKTLTILNAALHIRTQVQQQAGYTPRIIYCLPFTAIIDQNHAIFDEVLKLATQLNEIPDDMLLKHHHLTDDVFKTKEAEYQADGAGQLLTETWQSELVVTTFYQLLYTLLSSKNANLKRAGQLTGSIVLMDEIQAIPIRYWQMIRHLFSAMATALKTRFVLLTATLPLIFESAKSIELLPNHALYFKSLSRVQLHCYHQSPVNLEVFAEKLAEQYREDSRAMLVIVNRKSAVRQLYELLTKIFPNRPILALSTFFTPKDRKVRIRLMQRWLRNQNPGIVITTQLIEAGVDVSFPIVHRDLAPLDSIIQSAGRCNRHDSAQQGQVFLWKLYTDEQHVQLHWQKIYDRPLIEATENVLKQPVYQESEFLALSQDYFQAVQSRFSVMPVEDWLKAGNFVKISQDFQLIEEKPQRSLFVIKTPKDEKLWDRYRAIYRDGTTSPLEKQKLFSKIRRLLYERVIQVWGQSDFNEPIEKLEASDFTYTKAVGFIGEDERSIFC